MTLYVCNHCGRESEKRTRLCFFCQTDGLYEAGSQTVSDPGEERSIRAGDVVTANEPRRFRTPFKNLNEALNGGLAFPSVVQIAGPPNSGKSTLALQFIDRYAAKSLYIGGEETAPEIVRRARRLRLRHIDDFSIYCNNNPKLIQEEIVRQDPDIVVVDSSSVLQWSENDYLGPQLEAEVVHDMGYFAKKQHDHAGRAGRAFLLILVSHVIKDGRVAGTSGTQHAVDMTLVVGMNPMLENDQILINTKPLTPAQRLEREVHTQLRTISVKKTRSGGAPLTSPTFLLKADGLHEYP